MYSSPYPDLDKMIYDKCGRRRLQIGDPEPINIKCEVNGPLDVAKGYIMCNNCGSVIRNNYLNNHRSSGACSRSVEKQMYRGPYVNM